MTIKHLLVPTDLSESATLSIQYAALFARQFGARITALHADPVVYPTNMIGEGASLYVAPSAQSGKALESKLHAHLQEHLAGMPYEAMVVIGSPASAIVKVATDIDADLIVMGTHGRHGWRRALLGSVAEAVVHRAEQLVLTVAARPVSHWPARVAVTKIVCPINFTEVARHSLRVAAELADSFGAELIVLHVQEAGIEADDRSLGAQFRHWILPEVAGRVVYRELVLHGGAAERVLDCAEDLGADLLIIGAQRSTFADTTVIGTTTERLLRLASCPVLSVTRSAVAASDEHEYAGAAAL